MGKQALVPDAALEQHIAVLGKTGSGKTYASKAVIVEPLLDRGHHVGMIDPTGVWWGMRSSADGKGPGYPVLVLGGDHGDLPLPALGGAAVARLLSEQRVSLIADTSQLTVGERTRWMVDFAGTLYRTNRAPLYLILDEAHMFAPQGKIPDPDTGKMLHAVNTLASGGRARGIRLTMLTQRPAKLHKDTLTCADTLIAMRALAPHDRQAVKDWIDGCGDLDKGREVLDSLAGLQRGEGWVWYPEGGHLVRAKFPRIRTFDSSATPTHGHAIEAPKKAAEVNLTEIKAALAEAVKEAEENDPKRLRAEIARLKNEATGPVVRITRDELAVADQRGYERGRTDGLKAMRAVADIISSSNAAIATASTELASAELRLRHFEHAAPSAAPRTLPPPAVKAAATPSRPSGSADAALTRAERQVLIVLAQRSPKKATRAQLSILSGYSISSSSFANALGGLRSKGYSSGYADENQITEEGIKALGWYEPVPTGKALVTWWLGRLDKAARTFLEYIAGRYPEAVSKEELAGETGYSITSSSFANALGKLRSLELITRNGEIKAAEELFSG